MSDLDDLGDIADQLSFGTGRGGLSPRNIGRRPHIAVCNSPDHMKGSNVRLFRKRAGGKFHRACKLCEQLRREKATYSAQGYPL